MTNEIAKTRPSSLKAIKTSAVLLAIAATSAIAPSAFANGEHLVQREVSVKIAAADLSSADGVQKAYKKMESKATSFCKKDRSSLKIFNESVDECVEDLMQQFVSKPVAQPLKAYHEKMSAKTAAETLALN